MGVITNILTLCVCCFANNHCKKQSNEGTIRLEMFGYNLELDCLRQYLKGIEYRDPVLTLCLPLQMSMMANAGPYGGSYGQSAGQGLPGAGLGPQLQNKPGLPNNMANQFNMDKKTPPVQGMPGMVGFSFLCLIGTFTSSLTVCRNTLWSDLCRRSISGYIQLLSS